MTQTYNPFVQIIKSFEGFGNSGVYYKLRKQSTGSKILCALITAFLINLISFSISAVKLCNDKDISKMINDMPDFSFENSTLSVEKKYETKTNESYIIIDTDVTYYYSGTDTDGYIDAVNIDPLIKEVSKSGNITQAVFVSQSNILSVNIFTGQIQPVKFSELSALLHIPSFSKSDIQSGYKGFIIKWAVIIALICVPFSFGGLFLVSLFYGVLALLLKNVAKSNDEFNTLYWISFYINIAFILLKTLIKNTLPLGGGIISTIFFALFFIIMVKTLKDGDPDVKDEVNSYYTTNGSF